MRREGVQRDSLAEGAYVGTVVHQRKFDVEHGFRYPVWMALTPLGSSSLSVLLRPRWGNYLSLARIEELVGRKLNHDARIWLLTQPSLVGRSFNPVSFYFVTLDGKLHWILAHITNTPWDEEHCYVLAHNGWDSWTFDKEFHVSPFMPMALRYNWRFRIDEQRIAIDMHLLQGEQRVFFATLNLKPQASGFWPALRLRFTYPLQNARTLVRIYYQAALLKIKGARFHAHPDSTLTR